MIEQNEYGLVMRYGVPVTNPLDGWEVECDLRANLIDAVRQQERAGRLSILPQMGIAAALEDDATADA